MKIPTKSGYYWVRLAPRAGWEPATYSSLDDIWTVCGQSKWIQTESIAEIGGEITNPAPFKDNKTYYDGKS